MVEILSGSALVPVGLWNIFRWIQGWKFSKKRKLESNQEFQKLFWIFQPQTNGSDRQTKKPYWLKSFLEVHQCKFGCWIFSGGSELSYGQIPAFCSNDLTISWNKQPDIALKIGTMVISRAWLVNWLIQNAQNIEYQ